eukprot:SAG31_NODE_20383_length_576_cov_0.962264_1_plen_135_part_00
MLAFLAGRRRNSDDGSAAEGVGGAVAARDFAADRECDLSLRAGDRLVLLDTATHHCWWEAENEMGERGLVPKSYLEKVTLWGSSVADPGGGSAAGGGRRLGACFYACTASHWLGVMLGCESARPSPLRPGCTTE